MGALTSTWNKGKARSDLIDRQIKEESRNRARQVNVLLLGTDPDRSMIVKQMKIQHGLTKDERTRYRSTIYQNILDNAQALVRAIRDIGIEYANPMNRVRADHILDCPSFVFSPEIAEDIYQIWQDSIMPKVLDRRDEFYLENAEYFFKEILRIASPDYLPSDSDTLRARENPSQLLETRFTFGTRQVSIIDTGRSHSVRKWIYYFEDFHYAIFCVSLSHYDQVLSNGDCQNLLADSISHFECVTASRWLRGMVIILFLTNADIFKEKLSKIPMAQYFPEYTGGDDFDKAIEFITRKFMQVNRARLPVRVMHHPASNATTAQSIFDIVKHPIPKYIVEAW